MGCRVSIQFETKAEKIEEKSPVLYHHWTGNDLPKEAIKFLKKKYEEPGVKLISEVGSYLFDFIQHCFKEKLFDLDGNNSSSIFDQDETDLSDDCGHYTFVLGREDFMVKHKRGEFQTEPVLKRRDVK